MLFLLYQNLHWNMLNFLLITLLKSPLVYQKALLRFHISVYNFVDHNGKGYVGSSIDLYGRIYRKHRTNALSKTTLHSLFYSNVLEWDNYTLNLYYMRKNHLDMFIDSSICLTVLDKKTLSLLFYYYLTILEQAYMQLLDNSYNMQAYRNYGGGPNKGALGLMTYFV